MLIMENNNEIKLSFFKGVSKFKIVDSVFNKVEDKLQNKELEFYNIDVETINKINVENEGETECLYNLISVISNVETDVTIAEFDKMLMYPTTQLSTFIGLLLEQYKNLFENAKKLVELTNKTEKYVQEQTGTEMKLEEFVKLSKENKKLETDKLESEKDIVEND